MKNFVTVAAFAAGANALVGRSSSCCFHINVSGGSQGELGQLGDGQNRVGDNSLSPAQYCIDTSGGITDASGRGCILTPPTTQFQCDEGAQPTNGFSVNEQGQIEYNGSTQFYACETGQNDGLNIYTSTDDNQTGCRPVNMAADSCSGSGSGNGGSSPSSSSPAGSASPSSRPSESSGSGSGSGPSSVPSAPSSGSGSSPSGPAGGSSPSGPAGGSSPSGPGSSVTVWTTRTTSICDSTSAVPTAPVQTPSGPAGGSSPSGPAGGSSPSGPAGGSSPSGPAGGSSPSGPAGGSSPSGPAGGSSPSGPAGGSSPSGPAGGSSPSGPAGGSSPSGPAGGSQPSQSVPVQTPSGPAGGSQPSQSAPQPSSSTPSGGNNGGNGGSGNGNSCPTNLNGEYQAPHLIVPVDSSKPDSAPGTSYNGTISESKTTLYNFDIPQSYDSKTCSLVFLFPKQEDLETSAFTFSGDGKIDFAKLQSTVQESTSYSNMPSVEQDYGVTTVSPGNSYTISTFDCPAGQSVAYEMKNAGSTYLDFFEDYNPSPLGLYITTC